MRTPQPPQLPNSKQLRGMLLIHQRLQENWAHPGHCKTGLADLASVLEVSERTITRYLGKLMAPPYNLPIEFDREAGGYAYTSEVPFFPLGAGLTMPELLALEIARQSLAAFQGADFADKLESAFEKITGGALSDKELGAGVPIRELVSYRTPGAGVTDATVFAAILGCLLERQVLTIDYQSKGKPGPQRRKIHPYHLACIDNRWILIARDPAIKEGQDPVRTFVVARFSNPQPWGQERFERPVDFDASHRVNSAFGAHSGSGAIEVKLIIYRDGAHRVRERRWHPSQEVKLSENGELEMKFKVSDLGDITRWVLAFGSDCKVLAPKELREAIAAEAHKTIQLYKLVLA
jgi:proteasome accessory factor B